MLADAKMGLVEAVKVDAKRTQIELGGLHRTQLRERVALAASLAGYIALLIAMIPRHEPWADEAQAWQIANNNSFFQLFRTAIHYEFSPGLWHALLWVLTRLHLGYAGLPWVASAIALGGVCLILYASPLPLALRMVLPFTYFFAFQYAVVARSYVLFPSILFLLATLWRRRDRYPIVTALLIGMLANISSHGFVVAVGLFAVVLLEEWHRRDHTRTAAYKRLIALAIVCGMMALALWCLVPPPDSDWRQGLAGMAHLPAKTVVVSMNTGSHPMSSIPVFLRLPLGLAARSLYALSFGISQPRALAWLAWILLLWRWWRERQLRYSIPVMLLGAFCAATRFETHHAGLVWLLLLFLWWVTWPDDRGDLRQRCLIAAFSFFIACQVWWLVLAVRYDWAQMYAPNRAAAPTLRRYLNHGQQVDVATPPPEPREYGEYYAVGLEPYYATEPFHNEESRYWIWRSHPSMYTQYVQDTETRSVVVLVEEISNDPRIPKEEERLLDLGYRRDVAICGQMFYPLQDYPKLCHVFYVPKH